MSQVTGTLTARREKIEEEARVGEEKERTIEEKEELPICKEEK